MAPLCFLDMDGVLSDFVGAMCKAHNLPNPYLDGTFTDWLLNKAPGWKMSTEKFWKPADEVEFWSEMEKTPEADEIVAVSEGLFGSTNICILTSPSLAPACVAGKRIWIQKHYPRFKDNWLMGPAKHFCAGPGRMLVDDKEENCVAFTSKGGDAYLYPRPWNSRRDVGPELRLELNTAGALFKEKT